MKASGMAMVETLVAAALLALGLLGASRLTLRALDAAQQTRQMEQAQTLARDALDCALTSDAVCPASTSVIRQGVTYTLQVQRVPVAAHLTEVSVQVAWPSPAGAQQLIWYTRRSDMPDWLGVSSP